MSKCKLLQAERGGYGDTQCAHRVSSSMCRVLFDMPKANDILLFMTILSTDLRSLKRRGYNGERRGRGWSIIV